MREPGLISSFIALLVLAGIYWGISRGIRRFGRQADLKEPVRELYQAREKRSAVWIRPGTNSRGAHLLLGLPILLLAGLVVADAFCRFVLGIQLRIPYDLWFLIVSAMSIATAIVFGQFKLFGARPNHNALIVQINRYGVVGLAGILVYLTWENAAFAYLIQDRHFVSQTLVYPFYYAVAAIFALGGVVTLLRILLIDKDH